MDSTNIDLRKRNTFFKFWKNGDVFIWFSGGALFSILFIAATLLLVIIVNGLGVMWPNNLARVELNNGEKYLAKILEKSETAKGQQLKLKIANKDIYDFDYKWIDFNQVKTITYPPKALVVERLEYGDFYGFLEKKITKESKVFLVLNDISSEQVLISEEDTVRHFFPNEMNVFEKLSLYFVKTYDFLIEEPREANTEGGIFPAIFGTVIMIFIMSIFTFPLGVITAVYLKEYAKDGFLVKLIRIAVNNLAGVPSIVYGVFGLSFFIYSLGGSIDSIFFQESLPTPTFGTGGILWASLTLALLTVPVVIVTTEEALGAVPGGIKEASLALGATKLQTLIKVILPLSTPGILTGFILAMSRAAGEVAPLMLTGVVKLAPSLPIDSEFPFFHLNRKFMHLGFHIYDVGFQSPNVEAAKPMVYITAFLLILIVLAMSSAAIYLRSKMKRKLSLKGF